METAREIQDWLTEYKSLPASDAPNFGNKINSNKQLIAALLQEIQHSKAELQDPVFSQLYEFYRSGHLELKRFTLQCVPALIWSYLTAISTRESCGRLESLLLGIYNLEVIEPDGTARVDTFTVPTLAKPSIYHEPMSQLALTENVLSYQQSDHWTVTRGPLPQLKAINSQNRFEVLTHVLAEYNADISYLSSESHKELCNICCRLSTNGFENIAPLFSLSRKNIPNGGVPNGGVPNGGVPHGDMHLSINQTPIVRIPLSASFMLEMVNAVYYAMFNGYADAGIKTLDAIHFRAGYELYTEVLVSTNAIKHSLVVNPSGRPSDGPVGVNVTITPASPKVKRSLITNASFKIHRQQKAMIQVTIDGADSPTSKEPTSGLDSVDVAIVDKSGTTHVKTVQTMSISDSKDSSSSPRSPEHASHSKELYKSAGNELLENDVSYETTL